MPHDRDSSREDPLRFGVVGLGWLGTDLARQCRDHDRATVAALADVDADARGRLGDDVGVEPASRYGDYRAMLENELLDAVVVTTPHVFHYEQLLAALEADLHVLCEKPLCIDLENARELAARVESTDRTFMLGYQRHLNASFRAARERMRTMGAIEYVDAGITQPWTEIAGDGWRRNADLSGGGVFYDTGNHLVDGVLWTTDLVPESVTAEMAFERESESEDENSDGNRRVDVVASVSVTFENGAVGSLSIDGNALHYTEHNCVWTDEGGIVFDESGAPAIDADGTERELEIDREAERNKIEAFLDAVENGTEPPATVEHGVRAVALTEAAYEAARTGERVFIDR